MSALQGADGQACAPPSRGRTADGPQAGAARVMKIERYARNPIVIPGKWDWRRVAVFNPAVILDDDGLFYMFERACVSLRPLKCSVGLLKSEDGFRFEHVVDQPVFTPDELGFPLGTIEDPRVVKIDGRYLMTFAHRPFNYHCHPTGIAEPDYVPQKGSFQEGINNTRSGIAVSADRLRWEHLGWITPPEVDDRDNVLFPEKINGRYAMLRRPMTYVGDAYGCSGPAMWISYSDDLRTWSEPRLVAGPEQPWEGGKIGAAAPPLRTEAGWLTLFHGVDEHTVYRVGVMLLDGDNPEKVLARSPGFIMEPQAYYEKVGLIIPNVIFPTGNVIKDGLLYIYYGCADTCIAAATVPVEEVLEHVIA
jgi:predicted GH43/DUF377 family glycosyl hydrolase